MVVQGNKVAAAAENTSKLARVFQTRVNKAREHFTERVQKAFDSNLTGFIRKPGLGPTRAVRRVSTHTNSRWAMQPA
jgi:hypothetical protein